MRAALALFALLALSAVQPAGAASHCSDSWNLHPGSCGKRVSGLQWLLSGGKPNVFTKVKPTFAASPNGLYGSRTAAAVVAYKYRIGYPRKGQCGATADLVSVQVGPHFFALLTGKQTRSVCWVSLAAGRLKAIVTGFTPLALRVKDLEVSQLGVTESPVGSNRGPHISYRAFSSVYPSYQSSTGQYGAAWCVSFQAWAFLQVGYGRFADGSAGVYYTLDWAARRNLLGAKAKVGALVGFVTYNSWGYRVPGTGHMGFVTKVTASGFSYVAGNDSNGVREHFIGFGLRPYAFVYLPKLTE